MRPGPLFLGGPGGTDWSKRRELEGRGPPDRSGGVHDSQVTSGGFRSVTAMSRASPRRLTSMTKPTTFTGLSTVAVPVTNQDRTKALFEKLGFQTRFDADLGDGFRWIELVPPGAVTSIALVASGDELPTGVDTGIRLVTPDARAARAELLGLGLEAGELLDWDTAPLMFSFCDPDGNLLYVAEPT